MLHLQTEKKQKSLTPEVYQSDELEINGLKVFKSNTDEIVKKLDLKEIKKEGDTYYANEGIEFQIYDNEILYFSISSQEIILKNPDIFVGMSENTLKDKYPSAYKRLSNDNIGNLNLKSFEIYDDDDSRLRIYILNNKIYNITYLIIETL